jgi:hypothetical protein
VTERGDPPRWIAEPDTAWPDGFRDALAGYRREEPNAEVQTRLAQKLELATMSAAASRFRWLSFRIAGLIATAGIVAWMGYTHLRSQAQTPRAQDTADDVASQTEPKLVHAPSQPASRGDTQRPRELAVSSSLPEPLQPSAAGPKSAPPSAATVGRHGSKAARDRGKPEAAPSVPRDEAHSATTAQLGAAFAADTRAELELLIRARSLVHASPSRARQLVIEHETKYPQSIFAEEREVLMIDAERRLGHTNAANERARRFVQAHPNSIHAPNIEAGARDQ